MESVPTKYSRVLHVIVGFGSNARCERTLHMIIVGIDNCVSHERNTFCHICRFSTQTDGVLHRSHGARLAGHYGYMKTLRRVKAKYWWESMAKDVSKYVAECLQCNVSNDCRPSRQADMEVSLPTRRFEEVAVDVVTIAPVTKNGNVKVLVMIDFLTRFVRAVPIPDEKGQTLAKALIDQWISIFGPMERLRSDGNRNFLKGVVASLTSELRISQVRTLPMHPQANGIVERWHRTLARDLASYMATGAQDWDDNVALACFRYNTTVSKSTGCTPFKALFATDAVEASGEVELLGIDDDVDSIAERLDRITKHLISANEKTKRKTKDYYDRSVRAVSYQVGDRVLL